MPGPGRRFRFRPPRWIFWILGAAIAFVGAYIARALSEQEPIADRVPYWIAGSTFIFIGLYVLSLGTRSRQGDNPGSDETGQEDRAPDER